MLKSHDETITEALSLSPAQQTADAVKSRSGEGTVVSVLDRESESALTAKGLDTEPLTSSQAAVRTEGVASYSTRPDSTRADQVRPRVLHIDFSGYGVMTHILAILNYADHERWDHCVFYSTDPARPGVGRYREELLGTRFANWSALVEQWITWRDIPALLNTWRIIGQARPDVIHCHSGKAGALGRAAALLRGRIPVVYTPHSFPFQLGLSGSLKRKALIWIERTLGRMTDYITGVSDTEQNLALEEHIITKDRVCTISNGVDFRKMNAAFGKRQLTRAAFDLREDETVVCFLARLAPQKSPEKVVEAAAALAKMGHRPTFLMVGGGPLEEDCKALAVQLGVSSQFRWIGWRPYEEGLLLLAASDMMVLPSRYEGLPFSALESQAVETVPILSKVTGSSDAILEGQTGLFVPYGDVEALADAMKRLICQPEWRLQMAHAGRVHVLRNFNAETMTRSLETIYEKVLRKRKPAKAARLLP